MIFVFIVARVGVFVVGFRLVVWLVDIFCNVREFFFVFSLLGFFFVLVRDIV